MVRSSMNSQNVRVVKFAAIFIMLGWLFSFSGEVFAYEYSPLSKYKTAQEAEKCVFEGDYRGGLELLNTVLNECRNKEDAPCQLAALERMGWLNREIGNYGDALTLLRQAQPIGVKLNGDAAEIDVSLGDVALFSGDSAGAFRYYQEALDTLSDFIFKTSYGAPPSQ